MTNAQLAPTPIFRAFDNSGAPLAGGLLYTYAAGTTTPIASYPSSSEAVPNSNPIVLNYRGECALWLDPSQSYKLLLTDSQGNTIPGYPVDNITGILSGSVGTLLPNTTNFYTLGNSSLTWAQVWVGSPAAPVYNATYGIVGYYGLTAAEIAASATVVNYCYAPGDVRRYGVVADATVNGLSGTDNSTIINAILAIDQRTYFPTGNYGFKNLIIPNGACLVGDGINLTNFIALSGASGTMVTDNGSAAKTIIKNCSFFGNGPSSGNNTSYTAGFTLGKTIQFGTEGYIDQVQVRDLPSSNAAGFPGITITGNVGEMGSLYVLNTGGIEIIGSANMVQYIESVASQGWLLGSGQVPCVNLQDCTVAAMEIEAPGQYTTAGGSTAHFSGSTTVPLVMGAGGSGGNVSIGSIYFAFAANTASITLSYDHLIEVAGGATTYSLDNIKIYYAASTGHGQAAFTGLIMDANSIYYGGGSPTTTGTHAPEGNYASGMDLISGNFALQGQQLQQFTIELTAAASVIEHRIGSAGGPTIAGSYYSKIVGASNSYINTPTGTDSSTAFANGAKIGSASASTLWFNTANPQISAQMLAQCRITYDNSGTAHEVIPVMSSLNINGTTQVWFGIQLVNPTTWAGVNWATALSTSNSIILSVQVYLR